ncbi:MarR family winged helix-turn-helix transcriptional regulator [Streptomyces sp. NPDC085932]|uniref:MarR family winged helix-turn-helix transcriptional regulator n=1 Tax=Streptomyces sp. NPDC085932 TaxID=3365741 RepID=UPI0037D3724D
MSDSASASRAASSPPARRRELEDDLHWGLVRLARGLGAAEIAAMRPLGLTVRGYVVLSQLVDGPARSQLAIGRAAAMDKSVLVTVLDELEQAGFVTRTPDPDDRRVRIVAATPAGRDVHTRAFAAILQVEEDFLSGLTSGQRRAFRLAVRALGTGPEAATFDTRPVGI